MDVAFARSQFPSLSKSSWIYADNAGGSQCLEGVAHKITEYLLESNVQLGASYEVSQHAQRRYHEGYEAFRIFVNAAEACEIVCGSSSTAVISNFARAMLPTFKPGQEIIVSEADHESNITPWAELNHHLTIKFWKINPETQQLELEDLKRLLSEKTRLVTMTHCSNIFGTIHNIKAFAAAVHTVPGAEIFVDGVAYSPHRVVDVTGWDVDYYVMSVYKIYGPHISVGYAKKRSYEAMVSINHSAVSPTDIPYKIQPGRASYELVYSMTAILEYLAKLASGTRTLPHPPTRADVVKAFDLITQQEGKLVVPLLQYLLSQKSRGVTLIGSPESDTAKRVPTVSFVVKGLKSQAIVEEMDKHKIGIRWGGFYSNRIVFDSLRLQEHGGVVRISFVHYNTVEEVEQVIKALDLVLTKLL